jgi:predicted GNAT family acetyltransferase
MIQIVFEGEKQRAAAYDGDKTVGRCRFVPSPEGWTITHTETDPVYGGRGIAREMVLCVIREADKTGVPLSASCSFAKKVLEHTR